jgi:hypothetical protein
MDLCKYSPLLLTFGNHVANQSEDSLNGQEAEDNQANYLVRPVVARLLVSSQPRNIMAK